VQSETVQTFTVATNDFRGGNERTEYHPCVAWDRLAEICGQFLSKGQLIDLDGRLQTRSGTMTPASGTDYPEQGRPD
jgi:single-strand DNA-binding protein